MKKLTNLFVVVIVSMMTTGLFAQNLGVKAGLNLSNMVHKDDDDTFSDDYKWNPGFHAGLTADFPITEMFSFETGLLLSTRGFRISEEYIILGETYEVEGKLNLLYLEIPLTGKVSFDIGGAKIYGAFGPYVGVGLTGKSKSEITINGDTEKEEEDIEWGSDEEGDDLKRLDYGLTVGAGVEISAIQIGVSYGLGLAKINPDTSNGAKINNRVIGVSVGFRFGGGEE
jgi:opacity protein-like surface antigen